MTSIAALLLLLAAAASAADDVLVVKGPESLDKILKENDFVVLELYAPCKHRAAFPAPNHPACTRDSTRIALTGLCHLAACRVWALQGGSARTCRALASRSSCLYSSAVVRQLLGKACQPRLVSSGLEVHPGRVPRHIILAASAAVTLLPVFPSGAVGGCP